MHSYIITVIYLYVSSNILLKIEEHVHVEDVVSNQEQLCIIFTLHIQTDMLEQAEKTLIRRCVLRASDHDDVSPYILLMFEGSFSLDAAHIRL